MLEAQLQDFLHNGLWRGVRTTLWPVSEVFQSGGSGLLKALHPLVAGFAGEGVAQAELCDAFLAFEHVGNKLHSFVHNATLFPRHSSDCFAGPLWFGEPPNCYPSPRSDLLPLSPAYTDLA